MSDYMFMLESHLGRDQSRVVSEVQAAATEAGLTLYLTGGSMRDMLGGFAIRDLDFSLEGNPMKLAKALAQKLGAVIRSSDENRKCVELEFGAGVTAELSMARQERFARPGAKPQVTPATIYEDLRGRDFTVNAIALSLNRASRGLLIDPTNGLADLERRELRAVHNYVLYDDPVRLLRLVRLRVRLGFTVAERTQQQYQNARESEVEARIPPVSLFEQLRQISNEPNPADVVKAFDDEKLLGLFSPSLTGAKLNLAGLAKLQKAKQTIPFGVDFHLSNLGLFLNILTEKLTPKEKAALVAKVDMPQAAVEEWQKLDARAKRLEKGLSSAQLRKPSHIYRVLAPAQGDEVLYLLIHSSQRIVVDRIKNYLQKYLPAALEVDDGEIRASGLQPGSPKYQKALDEKIATRLDMRQPKAAPEPEAEPAPATPPLSGGSIRRSAAQPASSQPASPARR